MNQMTFASLGKLGKITQAFFTKHSLPTKNLFDHYWYWYWSSEICLFVFTNTKSLVEFHNICGHEIKKYNNDLGGGKGKKKNRSMWENSGKN